jgi:hypothetical protein
VPTIPAEPPLVPPPRAPLPPVPPDPELLLPQATATAAITSPRLEMEKNLVMVFSNQGYWAGEFTYRQM